MLVFFYLSCFKKKTMLYLSFEILKENDNEKLIKRYYCDLPCAMY